MNNHDKYKYSITIHTEDKAVLNCLRSLAEFSQGEGIKRIAWGNTKDKQWVEAGFEVTFHFTKPHYREVFVSELNRLLPYELWEVVRENDNDPAKPTKRAISARKR